eukprot:scaffold1172_cov247-Pinguiococcus_pyrenoidosus.AAC.14
MVKPRSATKSATFTTCSAAKLLPSLAAKICASRIKTRPGARASSRSAWPLGRHVTARRDRREEELERREHLLSGPPHAGGAVFGGIKEHPVDTPRHDSFSDPARFALNAVRRYRLCLVERLAHASRVIHEEPAGDHDFQRTVRQGANALRAILPRNRLIDLEIPRRSVVSYSTYELAAIRVGVEGAVGFDGRVESGDDLLPHSVRDRDGPHGPFEVDGGVTVVDPNRLIQPGRPTLNHLGNQVASNHVHLRLRGDGDRSLIGLLRAKDVSPVLLDALVKLDGAFRKHPLLVIQDRRSVLLRAVVPRCGIAIPQVQIDDSRIEACVVIEPLVKRDSCAALSRHGCQAASDGIETDRDLVIRNAEGSFAAAVRLILCVDRDRLGDVHLCEIQSFESVLAKAQSGHVRGLEADRERQLPSGSGARWHLQIPQHLKRHCLSAGSIEDGKGWGRHRNLYHCRPILGKRIVHVHIKADICQPRGGRANGRVQ